MRNRELSNGIGLKRYVRTKKKNVIIPSHSSNDALLTCFIYIFFMKFQMEMETKQFLQERGERIRLLREKQERELEQFDEESARLGFRLVFIFYCLIYYY